MLTREVWVYDLRTNEHFTLEAKPMRHDNLARSLRRTSPAAAAEREESERFKRYTHDEVSQRRGFNLDHWADVKDDSIEDPSLLPAPAVIAEEAAEHLSAALEAAQELSESLLARQAP